MNPEPADRGQLDAAVLSIRGLVVTFPAVRALDGVNFDLRRGEVHALLGENGAGKSTLINVLSGLLSRGAGSVALGSRPFEVTSAREAERAGISAVHQELDLVQTLTVAENICLGRMPTRLGFISWRQMRERAAVALQRLGVSVDPGRVLGSCSIAEQQLVAIARALDVDCKVLILDEPTSSLDAREAKELLALLRTLRDRGLSIILVTHFLDQAYAVADRITVLRNGRLVGTWRSQDLGRVALVEAMTGRTASETPAASPSQPTTEPLLDVLTLAKRGVIEPVSIAIGRGERVGIAGLLGSGRTELARLIFGADRPDRGEVRVRSRRLHPDSIRDAIAHGIAMTPEDRKAQGLILDLSVRDNIILAMQARRGPLQRIPTSQQQRLAEHYIRALSIRTPSHETPVGSLSGGNQQKVLLARWLAMQPSLLILDEPTRGIDVGARAEIEKLIASLRDQGMAVVLISAEIDEIARICERVIVMRDRRMVADLRGAQANEQAIVKAIAAPGSAA